jgi:hypothetical protein
MAMAGRRPTQLLVWIDRPAGLDRSTGWFGSIDRLVWIDRPAGLDRSTALRIGPHRNAVTQIATLNTQTTKQRFSPSP